MNALGNSKQKRLPIKDRELIEKLTVQKYNKDIAKSTERLELVFKIVLLETLEDCYHFGNKRKNEFILNFNAKADMIADGLLSNTYTTGNSDEKLYDRDYNIVTIKRYAEKHGLTFDETIFD